MTHKVKRSRTTRKIGAPPGTMATLRTPITEVKWDIELFVFDESGFEEFRITSQNQLDQIILPSDKIIWLNIDQTADHSVLLSLGEKFGLHSLLLEDISNPEQRPKMEEYDDHLFYTLKMLHYSEDDYLELEQISIVLGANYVLSFQEKPGDVFDPVRHRIRHGSGRLRRRKADYLAYALFDVVVDHYFILIDEISERMNVVEVMVSNGPDKQILAEIDGIRKDLLFEVKTISPLREAVAKLIRSQSQLIGPSTRNYLNDLQDNTLEILESLELHRQLNSSHRDMYFSSLTHKMNEVMKGLTIVATIFIPLTFVVGIYGMNFEYMPELRMRYGYYTVLVIMAFIAIGLILYFKKKGWV